MNQTLENLPLGTAVSAPVEPRLLAAEVLERLRDMIMQGELVPGVKLNERVLCERLRTSRTPVREAIKYLASEGLVELLPNRGAIVTPITAETVGEMFELLGALEALAGELACTHAKESGPVRITSAVGWYTKTIFPSNLPLGTVVRLSCCLAAFTARHTLHISPSKVFFTALIKFMSRE